MIAVGGVLSAVSFAVVGTASIGSAWKVGLILVDAAAAFYLTTRTKKGRNWVIRIENWLREFEA